MLTLDTVYKATTVLADVVRHTSLIHTDKINPLCDVYLKPENLQVTGSFKVRGAGFKISQLSAEEKQRGVIACSAGNHAQGVALAARRYGIPALICMPAGAPISKVEATRELGAEICLVDGVYDDAYRRALEINAERGMTFIHPFDDEYVIAGQGSVGMEILNDLPNLDVVIVPIGGGGLITGISTLAKMLNPKIKVIGVEPAGANCMQVSLKNKKVTTLPMVDTIADGTAVKTPGSKIFPYIQKNLDGIITVEDNELIVCFLDMLENHKMLVENSGLLTVAALKHLNVKGQKVVSILSGGNMDMITFASLVQHGLIARSRIFTVSTLLPDKPGALMNISKIIADLQGNIIKLEHNQFVSINRNSAVELVITLEAFGPEHKQLIINTLAEHGYRPKEKMTTGIYN